MKHVDVIEAICDAIMHYEGWNATTRSYRNRNPGNLRATHADQPQDREGYRVFNCFADGYSDLYDDIAAKVSGHNSHGLSSSSSLLQLFSVYAPQADRNAPVAYAAFVATWLRQAYTSAKIFTETTIANIFAEAGQEVPGGEHNAGHSGSLFGSVAEVPADRVDSGERDTLTIGKADIGELGAILGSGADVERLPDDRESSSAEAAQ